MNTKNNKRRRESVEKIEKAFVQLLQTTDLKKITVADICKMTGINRSTFYANYLDVYDLADRLRGKLEAEFSELFADYDYFNEHSGAEKMFAHIKENRIFYNTYFKLCYDESHKISVYDPRRAEQEHMTQNIMYHIEFFRSGLNAIMKMWLANDCRESPAEMAEILKLEYRGR